MGRSEGVSLESSRLESSPDRRLEQYCIDIGRDPSTLRRSLLVYPRFVDVWGDKAAAGVLIEQFYAVGFTEFVFYWPAEDQMAVFEHFVGQVMPEWQNSASAPPSP
jgi:hypothetical protein